MAPEVENFKTVDMADARAAPFTGQDVSNKPSRKRGVIDDRTPQKQRAEPSSIPPRQFLRQARVLVAGFQPAEEAQLAMMLRSMGAVVVTSEADVVQAAKGPRMAERWYGYAVCEADADQALLRRMADEPVTLVNAEWVHDALHQATTASTQPELEGNECLVSWPPSCPAPTHTTCPTSTHAQLPACGSSSCARPRSPFVVPPTQGSLQLACSSPAARSSIPGLSEPALIRP